MKLKQNLSYFCYFLMLISFFSCNEKKVLTNDELFKTLILDSIKYTKEFNAIIVLEDKGCIKCQFALRDFIVQNKNHSKCLFLIENDEKVVDLSDLKDLGDNVVFDDKRYLYNYNIINESSAILLDKNKNIDTIVSLNNSSELSRSLLYLSEVLD